MKFALLFVALCNFLLALYVFAKDPKAKLNRYFSIFGAIVGFWVFSNFLSILYPEIHIVQLSYAIGAFVSASALIWNIYLVDRKINKLNVLLIYIIASIFFVLSLFNNLIIQYKANYYLGYEADAGPLFSLYVIYHVLILFYILYKLFTGYSEAGSIKKLQLKFVFIGSFAFIIIVFGVSLFLPLFNIFEYTTLDSFGSTFLLACIAYAITRHRFFDIQITIKKSIIYSVSIIVLLAIYFYLAIILRDFFIHLTGVSETIVNLSLVLIVALVFLPLKKGMENLVEMLFFRENIKDKEIKDKLREIMSPKADFKDFFGKVVKEINKKIKIKKAVFIVFDSGQDLFVEEYPHKGDIVLEEDDVLISYLKDKKEVAVYDEIAYLITQVENGKLRRLKRVEDKIRKLDAKAAMPIMDGPKLMAMALLGPKKSQKLFTVQDVKFLEELSPQIAFALANIILYRHTMEGVVRRAQEDLSSEALAKEEGKK